MLAEDTYLLVAASLMMDVLTVMIPLFTGAMNVTGVVNITQTCSDPLLSNTDGFKSLNRAEIIEDGILMSIHYHSNITAALIS